MKEAGLAQDLKFLSSFKLQPNKQEVGHCT